MKDIYRNIISSIASREKLLAVLIDPDKMPMGNVGNFIRKVNASIATHIFVGGSTVKDNSTTILINEIKKYTVLPIIIFPGDVTQISEQADGLLFLSLISGRNPDYLIQKQVEAASVLRNLNIEVIPTGYILVENGKETTVQKVTGTTPLKRDNIQLIRDTAKAGELLGMQLIYLEAGSGATHSINKEIIEAVKKDIDVPLIVGGGIKNLKQLDAAYTSGADIVVIGNAFEKDEKFFESLIRIYN